MLLVTIENVKLCQALFELPFAFGSNQPIGNSAVYNFSLNQRIVILQITIHQIREKAGLGLGQGFSNLSNLINGNSE